MPLRVMQVLHQGGGAGSVTSTAAIERLLGDAALAARLGEAARETARITFSLDRTVERTLELYRSLVARVPLAPAAPVR